MQFQVLGPLEVRRDGQAVPIGGRRQLRLLAALLLEAGKVVPEDRLAGIVWHGEDPPQSAVRTMRTYVTRLRQALDAPEQIVNRHAGYVLLLGDGDELDSRRFEDLLRAAGREPTAAAKAALLAEALGVWRGDVLGELSDESWARRESRRLGELRARAVEDLATTRLSLDQASEVVAFLEPWIGLWPRRERLRALHMTALYRCGRAVDAVAAYQDYRRSLVEQTGLEPGDALRQLERQILSQDAGLGGGDGASVGRHLRGYRLGEVIGEGAFSLVYRGRHPSLGRDVAVKQIRAELANRPEFIRRFDAEAQMVARLEHPYVVPLYDYWREPDTAYLVMRFLPGGTLERRLMDGPLPLEACVRFVEQIGSALAAAHRLGVVHRDVKPANVLLDTEGNYFLGDFGIALDAAVSADPAAALSAGSPAYASPEQLRREPVGPPADVHGLGIAVFEALTGRLPFPAEQSHAALLERQLHDPIPLVRTMRTDVPAELDTVLQRATAKDPTDRYATIEEMVASFGAVLHQGTGSGSISRGGSPKHTVVAAVVDTNPYQGLRAFQQPDAELFFGRERLVDELVGALARGGSAGRLVTVVGPSGSGKSSVLRAGLLPALRAGRVPGSQNWFQTAMAPSSHPFDELEAALLRVAVNPPEQLRSQLMEDARGIGRAIKRILPDPDSELLLVVDQFEELFTLVEDETQRRRFLDGLAAAVSDPRSQLRVVLTLRADFYDRPLRHAEIASLVKQSTVTVAPLAPDELERAIVEPARRAGCEFSPGLVSQIVADVADQPGALPMLQYALTELFERRMSGLLTTDVYRALGGVGGALAARAEALHDEASTQEQAALRRIMGRLVTLGDGVADTRRRVLRRELGTDPAVDAVIERFGQARLLSFDRDAETREPTVEVAHEALLRAWPRLQAWLEADRDALRQFRHLHAAARAWEAAGRDSGELYRGARLDGALELRAARPDELSSIEAQFLDASDAARATDRQRERLRLRRLRALLSVTAIVAALAIVAGVVALRQQRRAESETARAEDQATRANDAALRAEIRRMVSDTAVLAQDDPALALLVAAAAHQLAPGVDTLGALQQALARTDGLLGYLGAGTSYSDAAFAGPDKLVGRSQTGVDIWNVTERRLAHRIDLGGPGFLAVTADGRTTVATATAGTVSAIDTTTGEVLTTITTPAAPTAVAAPWAAGAMALATGDGVINLLEPRTLTLTGSISGHQTQSMGFSPDDRSLVVPDLAGWMRRIELASGRVIWQRSPDERLAEWNVTGATAGALATYSVRFSPDGTTFNITHLRGGATRHDATTGLIVELMPPGNDQSSDAIDVDARRVLVGSELIDRPTGTRRSLRTSEAATEAVAVAPDSRTAAIASLNGIALWSLDGRQLLADAVPRNGATRATFDRAATRLAANRFGSTEKGYDYTLWDLDTRQRLTPELPDTIQAAFTPPGGFLTWHADNSTRAWAADDFAPTGPGVPPMMWGAANLDPSGSHLAIGGLATNSMLLLIYNPSSGALLHTITDLKDRLEPMNLERTQRWITSIEFSADGTLMAATTPVGIAGVWDVGTWAFRGYIELPDTVGVANLTFDATSSTLAAQDLRGGIHLLDARTLRPQRPPLAGLQGTYAFGMDHAMAFGPQATTLVVGSGAGAQLWDLIDGRPIGKPFPNDALLISSPAPNGRTVATTSGEHILLWDLDTSRWPQLACTAAGRDLTAAEWTQYAPAGVAYQPTCAQ